MRSILLILLLALVAPAQVSGGCVGPTNDPPATITVAVETTDASQFGYRPWSLGAYAQVAYRFSKPWEALLTGEWSNGKKAYVGNGHHLSGSAAGRFYFNDSVFVTAGALVSRDRNSQYSKTASRGFVGIGLRSRGLTGILTAFAPPASLTIDPNQVKGANLLVEYRRLLKGPLGLYVAGQSSLATFNATGGNPSARFTGIAWTARTGVYFSF